MNYNTADKEVKNVVYKITNEINGKSYIGRTTQRLKVRMDEHIRGNLVISRAIKKHGRENFTIKVLFRSDNFDDLNKQEKILVKAHDTLLPNGYNVVEGGYGTAGYKHKEETKLKMSQNRGRYYKEDNSFYKKKHTKEARKKMSNYHKGKKLTEEHKKKVALANRVKVINLNTKEVFNSVLEAAASVGVAPSNITRVCKGGRKTAGGSGWLHYEKYKELKRLTKE